MPQADLTHARLHYEIDGPADAPGIVFSHSIGANLAMWDAVLPHFAGRFRVLRYDARGHGASTVPPGPYTIADLGGDVLELLDALGIRRSNFCGLSMGGMIGMWLAVNAPERIGRLILANTGARIGTEKLWNDRIDAVRQGGVAAIADLILERWFTARFRQESPVTIETVRSMIVATSQDGYVNCCAAIRDEDLTESVDHIEAPSLILTGAWDPATPPSDGRILEEKIPRAAYVELATSHLSAIEDPMGFSGAVLNFLSHPEA
jgi:3-oxoadipate enol-lactonase